MELLQLKYFEAVVKHGGITKAAAELHISQPALSQSIARLEKELEVSLFIRQGKRIKLNSYGAFLYDRLPSILGTLEKTKQDLIDMSRNGSLRICLNLLSGSYLIPDLLKKFHEKYPKIKFELVQNARSSNCDIIISSLHRLPPDFNGTVLLKEEILLAAPRSFYKKDSDSVSISDFSEVDFISLSHGTAFRQIMDYYCEQMGFTPSIICESDSPTTVRNLVNARLGVSFWPEITWGSFSDNDQIRTFHIKNADCSRILYYSISQETVNYKATRLFSDFIMEYLDLFKNSHKHKNATGSSEIDES